ncbi:MAG TPA: hypothetical protein H9902_15230 [Candidatus Stackebrandtia faecavium]|nr:hypothetical protein [Candidatus Stackebrandtia faecavium]
MAEYRSKYAKWGIKPRTGTPRLASVKRVASTTAVLGLLALTVYGLWFTTAGVPEPDSPAEAVPVVEAP